MRTIILNYLRLAGRSMLSDSGLARPQADLPGDITHGRKVLGMSWIVGVLLGAGVLLGNFDEALGGPGACVDPGACYNLQCGQCSETCDGYAGCQPAWRYVRKCNDYFYGCTTYWDCRTPCP